MDHAPDTSEHGMELTAQKETDTEDPSQSVPTFNIALDGDVLMLVGEEKKQLNLRVLSTKLSSASKVFKAMFSQNFREGQALASTSAENTPATQYPVPIPFPDDDPAVMKLTAQALHLDLDKWWQEKGAFCIEKYAEMVDKYFLQDALMLNTEKMFAEVFETGKRDIKDVLQWLHVALTLEHKEAFRIVTIHLLLYFAPSDYHHILCNPRLTDLQSSSLQHLLSLDARYTRRLIRLNIEHYLETVTTTPHETPESEQYFGKDWKQKEVEYSLCGSIFDADHMYSEPLHALLEAYKKLPKFRIVEDNESIDDDHAASESNSSNDLVPCPLSDRPPGLCLMCFIKPEGFRLCSKWYCRIWVVTTPYREPQFNWSGRL